MTETTESAPRGQASAPPIINKSAAASWLTTPWPLLILLLLLVVLRCWVAGYMDFESDETYYWLWSRHLALSYFDHPPMVAYLIRLGTWLFGDTLLGVRSMAILAIILGSAFLYLLALTLFGDRRIGLLAVLWFNMMPHTAFFTVIMFPDTPALLFWILSCLGLALVWRSGRGEGWYLVAIATGLLLLSKYTGLFLVFGIGVWLLLAREMRPWLRRGEPYLAGLTALALFSPVIIWNAQHGWVSFAKQFSRAFDRSADGGIANLGAFVGIQAAFVSPVIFLFALGGIGIALSRGLRRREGNWLLLGLTSAPMLLYFLFHALSAEILPQWPSAAYPVAILAAVAAFAARADDPATRAWLRWGFNAAPWIGLAMTAGMYVQMTVAPAPVSAARDPLSRFAGWAELALDTRAAVAAQNAAYVTTSEYGTNAILAFYLRDLMVFQASEAIRYAYLPPVDQARLSGATGLYLTAARFDDVDKLRRHFDSVELLSTIQRRRNGNPIEPFRIYKLSGYRGGLPY